MNTRRNACRGRGETAAGGNKVPFWGPTAEMERPVNPTRLTDREVRTVLVQMALDITSQAPAMTAHAKQQGVPKKSPPASTIASRLRDFTRMNHPIYTWSKIAENLEEEYRVAMLHTIMGLSRLMIHVQQVEESSKRKHTREGNKSRQVEKNFSINNSTEIRNKPMFKKGLSHQGQSSSTNGCYDRKSKSRVKNNNKVNKPQERPPCMKCGKLHGGDYMMGTNTCYSFVQLR